MNPLMSEAGRSVELGWLLGVITVFFFASFLYWVWYAYAPSRRPFMDRAAQMPFDGADE